MPALLLSDVETDKETLFHQTHCFEYLRQTIMCAMDMTVEAAAVDINTGLSKGYINGWETEHRCVDQVSWTPPN